MECSTDVKELICKLCGLCFLVALDAVAGFSSTQDVICAYMEIMLESYMEVTSHTVWCTINTGTLKSRLWTFKSGSCGLVCITLSILCALTQSCALALIFFSHETLLVFTITSRTVNGNTILTT
jgi:hypothetical protein